MWKRYLHELIMRDLSEKMAFVAGPRQVGKTTLAKRMLEETGTGLYLSWDRQADRRQIRQAQWPAGQALVVLDELHKLRGWKRWLKGELDQHRERLRFLVTGSARLDVYRRGGDSLQGRYHHFRLHPLTVAEMEGVTPAEAMVPGATLAIPSDGNREALDALMRFGGFPEPLAAASARSLRRWQKERIERFFREDVRDLETVRDLSGMQLLADIVGERIGAPFSLNAVREDLEVSHKAAAHWLDILERLYHLFLIRPFATRALRGLRKMPKVYLWDTSTVADDDARFENLVASHLLKLCHYLEDTEGYTMELHYLRDTAQREVDFVVTADRQPWFAVEAKLGNERISPALRYFGERLRIPQLFQVTCTGDRDYVDDGVRCLPAHRFLRALV